MYSHVLEICTESSTKDHRQWPHEHDELFENLVTQGLVYFYNDIDKEKFWGFKSLWQSVYNVKSSGLYCSILLKRASVGTEELTVSHTGMVCLQDRDSRFFRNVGISSQRLYIMKIYFPLNERNSHYIIMVCAWPTEVIKVDFVAFPIPAAEYHNPYPPSQLV